MGNDRKNIPKELHDRLIEQAREFRQNPTRAEAFLWEKLRGRQLGGYKFKRQRVFGPFILDFYCPECKLVIELDGEIHQQQTEYDVQRTKRLQTYGVTVIRFNNHQVIKEIESVLEKTLEKCKQMSSR